LASQQPGLKVLSLRGHRRSLPDISSWPTVVVIAHPLRPAVVIEPERDALVLSIDDWLSLHQMIRSTAGIIDYIHRAVETGLSVPLGGEASRYQRLAAADANSLLAPTMRPFLPTRPLDDRQRLAADLFDDLIEKVSDSVGATGWDSMRYLEIVEQLDLKPVLVRADLGTKMFHTISTALATRGPRGFISYDRESHNRFAFRCEPYDPARHSVDGEEFMRSNACYGLLRHHQGLESGAPAASTTLAVGRLEHPELGTRHVFALFQGDVPALSSDLRHNLELEYGVFTGTGRGRSIYRIRRPVNHVGHEQGAESICLGVVRTVAQHDERSC
jgi:hypothetical protein